MARRSAPMDKETTFVEDLVLTATAATLNNKILKVGKGRQDFTWVLQVDAIDIASNDESYRFILQGSNTADFSGTKENLGEIHLGAAAVRLGGARASVVGRYAQGLANDVVGDWDYVRVNAIVAGTTPSITVSSWITKNQLPM